MRHLIGIAHLACALALLAGCAGREPATRTDVPVSADMLRGADLYQTYCIACHTAQMHWREKRLVRTWDDLRYQVTRWQNAAGQRWSRQEIDDVAAYLNKLFYEAPCPLPGCGGPPS